MVSSASRGSVISVAGLSKSYRSANTTVPAVQDVSFEVAEGEVFALLGPNGAGKTTTVEILEGYRRRDTGAVQVLGMDPERGGHRLRERIGIVLQELGIEPYLTVTEVVTQRATFYPSPRPVPDVIALAGLEEKARARVRLLSGGQLRRLDLALALVGDPELLFLDEPTTGFDPSARRGAWEVVRGLCRMGRTVVLTTHYMDEAQALADRVAVIAGGRIVAIGPPETLGGRDAAATVIRFGLPTGTGGAALGLDELPLDCARLEGDEVVVESSSPTRDLNRLTGWALEKGLELPGLTVVRPSLEDVDLEIVGG
jgi:ABC-2 type transport system ATP-binding protein